MKPLAGLFAGLSLTGKLTAALVTCVLLVQGALAASWLVREHVQLEREVAHRERALADALASAMAEVAARHGEAEAHSVLDRVGVGQPDGLRIRWVEAGSAVTSGRLVHRDVDGVPSALWATPIPGRPAFIEVSGPMAEEQAYRSTSVWYATAAMVATVVTCGLLAFFLGHIIVARPVRAIVQQTRRVAAGDLSRRLPVDRGDELGRLARELNRMTESLDEARGALERETQRRVDALSQLRHADRLRTVGTLAAGLAHELGTPLHCVQGYAEMICDADDTHRDHARTIIHQADRMTRIVDQLLAFARRDRPFDASCSVREVSEAVLALVRPLARTAGVTVDVAIDGDPTVACSGDELQQVLANLVVNAVHALADEGGSLRIEAAQNGGVLELRVVDDGPGMPTEVADRVFEPFFTTKDVGEGTGLGLSVAFGIVEDRGGSLTIASASGEGTAVTVTLPAPPA